MRNGVVVMAVLYVAVAAGGCGEAKVPSAPTAGRASHSVNGHDASEPVRTRGSVSLKVSGMKKTASGAT